MPTKIEVPDIEKTYYLSGPMTGKPHFNFPAFAHAAHALRKRNIKVVSAHEVQHNDNGQPGSIDWHDYLRGDLLVMLQTCNAIILLEGHEHSTGAKLELYIAEALNMPVYLYLNGELHTP